MTRAIRWIPLLLLLVAVPARTAEPSLPGAAPFEASLAGKIRQVLAAEGKDYVPRTRHLLDDGSPRYTNRLIFESSPYLRQHAHNPVNWFPWGDEAFAVAAELGRPVLLSIGYSTCHWCHVMEEESFEDEEIARYMNEHYVAIKVDREERPDLDAVYMSAVQMMTGRGGWPMTTWLTHDREPFFGGTYFPARDGDRGTRIGFLTLLKRLEQSFHERPQDVVARAQEIVESVRRNLQGTGSAGSGELAWAVVDRAVSQLAVSFDAQRGGTKRAPKFPSTMPNRLLLRQHLRSGDEQALEMARVTLTRMAEGGIYDQIGGGFHRYSTDANWLVPHFEKMLYDNALLASAYVEAWQLTQEPLFRRVAGEVLDYVAREMTSQEGGFYSATDADSLTPQGEREEGWFFTWTPAELADVLGADEKRLVTAHYGVSDQGNFEGRTILHVAHPLADVAREFDWTIEKAEAVRVSAAGKLYRKRSQRPAPLLDDKILTSWNGLMISAFARAGFVFDVPDYTARAERAANLLLTGVRKKGRLLRSYKDGVAKHNAYLEDYAFLIAGLLDLFETTGKVRWFHEAASLQKALDTHYADENGGYFETSADHETLLAREKPGRDGAEPSGNSVALMNLLRLHELTTDDRYRATADKLLAAFHNTLTRSPRALNEMLLAVDFKLGRPKEVVLVHSGKDSDLAPFLAVLRSEFLPRQVLVHVSEAEARTLAEVLPILKGKRAGRHGITAYVCEAGICALPTSDAKRFRSQLTEPVGGAGVSEKIGSNDS